MVVPAREEQDDLRLPGLDVQTGGVDCGPHVPGRLPKALQRLDLLVARQAHLRHRLSLQAVAKADWAASAAKDLAVAGMPMSKGVGAKPKRVMNLRASTL